MVGQQTQATPDTQDNEALIQEMLRTSQKAELPSELAFNPVIHKGDESLVAPMTVKEISSAGYVWVWDTRTFDKVPVIYYMLPSRLRQRRIDGSFRFTTIDPKQLPKRGTIKCMLHPESENRRHYNELGFRTCDKSNLTNAYQMNQHMIRKHPQEWKTIEGERLERERLEDRQLQRAILQGMSGKQEAPTTDAPLYISEKDKTKIKK
jgi:hypothetical protein